MNNPIWLCCLPMWHFVTKRVVPFERAQLSAKHAQSEPLWWGIDGLRGAVDNIKKIKWFVNFEIVLFSPQLTKSKGT